MSSYLVLVDVYRLVSSMCGIFVYSGPKMLASSATSLKETIISMLQLRGPDEHTYLAIEAPPLPHHLI